MPMRLSRVHNCLTHPFMPHTPCSHCQEYERQIRDAGGIDLQARLQAITLHARVWEPGSSNLPPERDHAMPRLHAASAMAAHLISCLACLSAPDLRLPLQILGLGRTGHIGFNEKGSSRASTTRLITLDRYAHTCCVCSRAAIMA